MIFNGASSDDQTIHNDNTASPYEPPYPVHEYVTPAPAKPLNENDVSQPQPMISPSNELESESTDTDDSDTIYSDTTDKEVEPDPEWYANLLEHRSYNSLISHEFRHPQFMCPKPDPTIPQVLETTQLFVKMVTLAISNTSDIIEKPTNKVIQNRWQPDSTYYTPSDFEALAWRIVAFAIAVHKNGWVCPVRDRLTMERIKKTKKWTFEERIVHICDFLRTSKSACDEMLRMNKFYSIIGNPVALGKIRAKAAKVLKKDAAKVGEDDGKVGEDGTEDTNMMDDNPITDQAPTEETPSAVDPTSAPHLVPNQRRPDYSVHSTPANPPPALKGIRKPVYWPGMKLPPPGFEQEQQPQQPQQGNFGDPAMSALTQRRLDPSSAAKASTTTPCTGKRRICEDDVQNSTDAGPNNGYLSPKTSPRSELASPSKRVRFLE
ncbi:hypothetical protein M011DRAFT_489478 [Sporormia fimetaria CBS 119925]|uniref:Uncharacterized protein n=1 Tax=Sporormia fimetaria CBS 119925 TaxID=1340428 RepID=A0A6A6V1E4_9PLEO|nr:hypothetical protein M011DRAFT_489478 [Sporormia fimetaria CBS 119925]